MGREWVRRPVKREGRGGGAGLGRFRTVCIYISPFIVKIHRTNYFPALDVRVEKGRARF